MRVQVDEAGRDNQAVGLEQLLSVGRIHLAADLGDAAVLDPNIGNKSGDTGPVNDGAAADQYVKLGHHKLLMLRIWRKDRDSGTGSSRSALYWGA